MPNCVQVLGIWMPTITTGDQILISRWTGTVSVQDRVVEIDINFDTPEGALRTINAALNGVE